jgi:hypothetical protein
MLVAVDITSDEKAIRLERPLSPAERRNRNAQAIAEVVGRNPVKKPRLDSFRRNSQPRQPRS